MSVKIIQQDSRQKKKHHEFKERWFKENGYEVITSKMLVGDYQFPSKGDICVDTKKDLQEVVGNICGKEHDRFKRELIKAGDCGIKLYVLVENKDNVNKITDVFRWVNPRLRIFKNKKQLYPNATRGKTLAKAMLTIEAKYGVKFMFCKPEDSGRVIIEILEGKYE